MMGAWFAGLMTIICSHSWAAETAPPKTSDPFEQCRRLGRGINILGYDPRWKSPEAARLQAEHFRLIREAGFQNVRINLFPFRYVASEVGDPDESLWYATLDWAVDQSLDNQLMPIIDFHNYSCPRADAKANKERFLAVWKRIAQRYRSTPPEVVFEILNEPCTLSADTWNQLLVDALAVIRETNPTRTVIIGPTHWNEIARLKDLRLPPDDRNIIVTVHYYSPVPFTHQGLRSEFPAGVSWNDGDRERQAIARDFEEAQAWAQQQNRPIFLGEFGVYDKAEMESRVRWTNCVRQEAERLGWSWAYWQFDPDFAAYDVPNHRWVEPVRDALIPR